MDQIKIIGSYQYNPRYLLGQGAFGKVFEGIEPSTKKKVAIKQIQIKDLNNDNYLQTQIQVEISILKKLNHKNIVKFFDAIQTYNSLYLVQEFCQTDLKQNNLKRQVIASKNLNENEIIDILMQLIDGFTELNANNIIHRDMKPANVLILGSDYKICDFGFAKFVDDLSKAMVSSIVGSPLYMAPQILQKKPYSAKCDIWSLGLILYEMLFGVPMWTGVDQKDLLKNILYKPLQLKNNRFFINSRKISPQTEDMLRRMLRIEERDRISWEELFDLKTKFFQQKKVAIPNQIQQGPVSERRMQKNNSQQIFINRQQVPQQVQQPIQRKTIEIIDEPEIIIKQKLFPTEKIRDLIQQKKYFCFQHFVSVELETNNLQLQEIIQEECLLEKFMLLNSKQIMTSQQNFIGRVQSDEELKNIPMMKEILEKLQEDIDFSLQFYEQIVEKYKDNQVTEILKYDKEFCFFFEKNDKEQYVNIMNLIQRYGNQIVQRSLKRIKELTLNQNSRSILVLIDYLIDFLRLQKNQNLYQQLDFINFHVTKAKIQDSKAYYQELIKNARSIEVL